MNRAEFLTQVWTPYPAMPENSLVVGRVYRIEFENAEFRLILRRDQKEHIVSFSELPSISEHLREGDLLAVTQEKEIILLAPCLGPLPQRTLNPEILKLWGKYLTEVRNFFQQKDFLEVRTPSLVACPGTEPSLDVFQTELSIGSKKKTLFLPTSPELHLKKALSFGADKIFEISNCFRNGEVTQTHQPEFLMLEWYRAYSNLFAIKEDVVFLIRHLAEALQVPAPKKVVTYSVSQLFEQYCQFQLTPQTSMEELKDLATKLGVDVHSAESIDDYFFLIFMDKIESQLPADHLVFVEKYPPYQAALARLTSDGWGDRFEAYWKGMELCNAFHELNDPKIQKLRAQEDLSKKKQMMKSPVPLDEEFFVCLQAGMPPSGGIALGLERLFMAFYHVDNISDLRVFPL